MARRRGPPPRRALRSVHPASRHDAPRVSPPRTNRNDDLTANTTTTTINNRNDQPTTTPTGQPHQLEPLHRADGGHHAAREAGDDHCDGQRHEQRADGVHRVARRPALPVSGAGAARVSFASAPPLSTPPLARPRGVQCPPCHHRTRRGCSGAAETTGPTPLSRAEPPKTSTHRADQRSTVIRHIQPPSLILPNRPTTQLQARLPQRDQQGRRAQRGGRRLRAHDGDERTRGAAREQARCSLSAALRCSAFLLLPFCLCICLPGRPSRPPRAT